MYYRHKKENRVMFLVEEDDELIGGVTFNKEKNYWWFWSEATKPLSIKWKKISETEFKLSLLDFNAREQSHIFDAQHESYNIVKTKLSQIGIKL